MSRGANGLPAVSGLNLPSFIEYVALQAPELLRRSIDNAAGTMTTGAPHATTIIAMRFDGGVLMAGDRRATTGNVIASSHMNKVFEADSLSAIGIAGAAGIALELVRLFQLELEHYEKIEGSLLSLEGKANRLAAMVRGNMGLAVSGLPVMPVFAGWDQLANTGRIFSYDVTGGRYEERDHHSVGSGSLFARGTLKSSWRPGLTEADAINLAITTLVDVAEEDSATAGPDVLRSIWPVIAIVTAQGYREVPESQLSEVVADVLAVRKDAAAALRASAPPDASAGPGKGAQS